LGNGDLLVRGRFHEKSVERTGERTGEETGEKTC
jgi:hypothetical protein